MGNQGGPTGNEIGRVNGVPISGALYEQLVQQQRLRYQQQGGTEIDERTELTFRSNTWTSLVQQALIDEEAKRLGLTASDEEVVAAVLNSPQPDVMSNPSFMTNGQFDISKYQAAIRSLDDNTLRMLEAQARSGIPATKLQQVVMGSAMVGDAELWDAFRMQNDKLKINYLLVPAEKFAVDATAISQSDLERYYQAHKKTFETPPQATLQFVSIPKKTTDVDSLAIAQQMRDALQEVREGEDFLVVVDAYTEAPANQRGGPTATWIAVEPLSPAVREAARTLPVGQMSDLLVEPGGFHCIRVEERKEEAGSMQVRLADLYLPIRATVETLEALRQQALDFRSEVAKRDFAQVAQEMRLPIKDTGAFRQKGFISGIGSFPELQNWAFANEEGAISPPYERTDSWVVARLTKKTARRLPDFTEVQDRVRQTVADSLKVDQAAQAAQSILPRAQAGEPLETIAKADPTWVYQTADQITRSGFVAGIGRDPALLGSLFGSSLGVVPKVIRTARGAVVAQVTERVDAERGAFEAQKEMLRGRLMQQRQNEAVTAWMEALQANAKIEDFRYGTYQ